MSNQTSATQATTAITKNGNVVPTKYKEHTADRPFCGSGICHCRKDRDAIAQVNQWYMDGLITMVDAYRIYEGRAI